MNSYGSNCKKNGKKIIKKSYRKRFYYRKNKHMSHVFKKNRVEKEIELPVNKKTSCTTTKANNSTGRQDNTSFREANL